MFGISGYVMGGMAAVIAALCIIVTIQWNVNARYKDRAVVAEQDKELFKNAYVKLFAAVKEHNKICDVIPPIVPDDEVKPDGGRRRIFPWLRSEKLEKELTDEFGVDMGLVPQTVDGS